MLKCWLACICCVELLSFVVLYTMFLSLSTTFCWLITVRWYVLTINVDPCKNDKKIKIHCILIIVNPFPILGNNMPQKTVLSVLSGSEMLVWKLMWNITNCENLSYCLQMFWNSRSKVSYHFQAHCLLFHLVQHCFTSHLAQTHHFKT